MSTRARAYGVPPGPSKGDTMTDAKVCHRARKHNPYRDAAETFWPDLAGPLYDAFDRINAQLYADELPQLPIVVGLTPHGRALGLCHYSDPPRLTIHPSAMSPKTTDPWGVDARRLTLSFAVDVLTHEMVHAWLHLQGLPTEHNTEAWADEIMRQGPLIGVEPFIAAPWKRARTPDGFTYKPTREGAIPRQVMAAWPYALRPADYYTDPAPWFDRAHDLDDRTPGRPDNTANRDEVPA